MILILILVFDMLFMHFHELLQEMTLWKTFLLAWCYSRACKRWKFVQSCSFPASFWFWAFDYDRRTPLVKSYVLILASLKLKIWSNFFLQLPPVRSHNSSKLSWLHNFDCLRTGWTFNHFCCCKATNVLMLVFYGNFRLDITIRWCVTTQIVWVAQSFRKFRIIWAHVWFDYLSCTLCCLRSLYRLDDWLLSYLENFKFVSWWHDL
jgi:hypothetical protein